MPRRRDRNNPLGFLDDMNWFVGMLVIFGIWVVFWVVVALIVSVL